MLYKVTPLLTTPEQTKAKVKTEPTGDAPPKQPRKRRKAAVYDAEGNEVLITMMCLKCRQMKPLLMFGLRKMADGAIRNQPWCRTCRSGASPKKHKHDEIEVSEEAQAAEALPETTAATASNSTASNSSADAGGTASAEAPQP